ncbi:hypothetical protein BZG36_02147 [Bifiguratus adelaidae]|uniref:F-box domain-containing protein n=1 Tax=Bifiguratus adelaidae TaxID=1938954 RepID=A0A261Y384_9FUNG|nr:hypothetical protein BZG36_02147 [Bifiguratus adelaidae]
MPLVKPLCLEALPPEILLDVATFVTCFQDRLHLCQSSSRIRSVLIGHEPLWYTLSLSPLAESITDAVLSEIFRELSSAPPLQPKRLPVKILDLSGCFKISSLSLQYLERYLPSLRCLQLGVDPAEDDTWQLPKGTRLQLRKIVLGRQRQGLYKDWRSSITSPVFAKTGHDYGYRRRYAMGTLTSSALKSTLVSCGRTLESLTLAGHCLARSALQTIASHCISLRYLDISGCEGQITQGDLQTLFEGIGPHLETLKMTNMSELSDLTSLFLVQHCGKTLRVLHISGGKYAAVTFLTRAVSRLPRLEDLRINQIVSGDVNGLVLALRDSGLFQQLTSLDLSPKLDIYPSNRHASRSAASHTSPSTPSFASGMRMEHALAPCSDQALDMLCRFERLTTLRLVNPAYITSAGVNNMLRHLPQLQVLELRRWQDMQYSDGGLTTISPDNLPDLRECVLYSILIPPSIFADWTDFRHLKLVELWDASNFDHHHLKGLLLSCPTLRQLRIAKTSVIWDDFADILGVDGSTTSFTPSPDAPFPPASHLKHLKYDGEIVLSRLDGRRSDANGNTLFDYWQGSL